MSRSPAINKIWKNESGRVWFLILVIIDPNTTDPISLYWNLVYVVYYNLRLLMALISSWGVFGYAAV